MSVDEKGLPEFGNPPLCEVAMSVQFEPVDAMRAVHVGLLWNHFREQFPQIEEQPPLEPVFEQFGGRPTGPVDVTFKLTSGQPPLNRVWFLNADGTQLIQIQRDRVIHNWRKVGDNDAYPRYEAIRGVFRKELEVLSKFIGDEKLGEVVPNQVELSYVDHIAPGDGWVSHTDLDRIVTVYRNEFSDPFLGAAEAAELSVRFVMKNPQGEPLGRLHVHVQPVYRLRDGVPIYLMRLTARGRPAGLDVASVIEFMDLARAWVVRGFSSITTPAMHTVWQRRDRSS